MWFPLNNRRRTRRRRLSPTERAGPTVSAEPAGLDITPAFHLNTNTRLELSTLCPPTTTHVLLERKAKIGPNRGTTDLSDHVRLNASAEWVAVEVVRGEAT